MNLDFSGKNEIEVIQIVYDFALTKDPFVRKLASFGVSKLSHSDAVNAYINGIRTSSDNTFIDYVNHRPIKILITSKFPIINMDNFISSNGQDLFELLKASLNK